MLSIREDMHEMPQVICLRKVTTRQIKTENFAKQKHLHW